ncbi:MAG: hypothetical protein ACYC4K_10780 [Thiobacillus sp.]
MTLLHSCPLLLLGGLGKKLEEVQPQSFRAVNKIVQLKQSGPARSMSGNFQYDGPLLFHTVASEDEHKLIA